MKCSEVKVRRPANGVLLATNDLAAVKPAKERYNYLIK